MTNRPVSFSDPTGHVMTQGDGGGDKSVDCEKYPQYCNGGDPKSTNDLLKMRHKRNGGGWHWPFGQVIGKSAKNDIPDGDIISLTLVTGIGPWYAHSEVDLVCVHGNWSECALFRVRGVNQNNWNNLMIPQWSISASGGRVVSTELRNNPTVPGIIEAFKGEAREEGYSALFFTENWTSSSDSDTYPNFNTRGHLTGVTVGVPLGEAHSYTTEAFPIWDSYNGCTWSLIC